MTPDRSLGLLASVFWPVRGQWLILGGPQPSAPPANLLRAVAAGESAQVLGANSSSSVGKGKGNRSQNEVV